MNELIIPIAGVLILAGIVVYFIQDYLEKKYIKRTLLAYNKGYHEGNKQGVTEVVNNAMLETLNKNQVIRYNMRRSIEQGNLVFLIEVPMSKGEKNDYINN